jgi:hypothetical protein
MAVWAGLISSGPSNCPKVVVLQVGPGARLELRHLACHVNSVSGVNCVLHPCIRSVWLPTGPWTNATAHEPGQLYSWPCIVTQRLSKCYQVNQSTIKNRWDTRDSSLA